MAIGDGWLGVSDLAWSTMEAGKSIPSILAALAVMLGTSGDIRDVNELGVPDLEDPGVFEWGIWYPLKPNSFCCCPRGGCGVTGRDRGCSNLKSEGWVGGVGGPLGA